MKLKIGYSVEGSTDVALIKGLAKRWCPYAETIEGKCRGRAAPSRRRDMLSICLELASKNVDLIVFLTDSNDHDPNAWKTVVKQEEARLPNEYAHLTVFGVCQQNVECWLCADADWLSTKTSRWPEEFRMPDPKRAFESALGIQARDRKEEEISALVQEAPLHNWLRNRSFEDFYDRLWQKSKTFDGCDMENLRKR
jgi:hypothetical protein